MFIIFCSKFIQETTHKISSESHDFQRKYYKQTILVCFFRDTVYNKPTTWRQQNKCNINEHNSCLTNVKSTVFTLSVHNSTATLAITL